MYSVKKRISDDEMKKKLHTEVDLKDIKMIIREDMDLVDEKGNILLIFRKNVLSKENRDSFYDATHAFAKAKSNSRGSISTTKHTMSNIFGYFDTFSRIQKQRMCGKKFMLGRETRFNIHHPDKYVKTIPLLEEINTLYKKYAPEHFEKQNSKAREMIYRIGNSSFSTVTVNINFQTKIHTDKGDDEEGLGNLIVFERKGSYIGGETCLPQYAVGVDVREGDILFMNVHEYHGNLPIQNLEPDTERMSVVAYLRKKLWETTKNIPKEVIEQHNKNINLLLGSQKGYAF